MTVAAKLNDLDAHADVLADFLPNGPLFEAKKISTSNLRKLLRGLATELMRAEEYINTFDNEYDPRTTSLLIDEWERGVGIPDACLLGTGDLAERRSHVVAKLSALGLQTVADFVALGAVFGIAVTVEALDSIAIPPIPIVYPDARFIIVVTGAGLVSGLPPYDVPFTPGSSESVLECLFNLLKPVNCNLLFVNA